MSMLWMHRTVHRQKLRRHFHLKNKSSYGRYIVSFLSIFLSPCATYNRDNKSLSRSVASRSVRMQFLLSIAEPIPACEGHLHSRAHGFSHGLPADADVGCCGCDAAACPPIHSLHPFTASRVRERTTSRSLNEGSQQRKIVPSFLDLLALFLLGVCKASWRSDVRADREKRNTLRISVPDGLSKSASRSE